MLLIRKLFGSKTNNIKPRQWHNQIKSFLPELQEMFHESELLLTTSELHMVAEINE
jgi:hypothetical protein